MSKETGKEPILLFESVDLARTFREWKSPLLSVEFLFIQTFEDLISAHTKLLEKKKEFEFHDCEMKSKWDRLKMKQAELMGNMQKYDAFFIENEEKSNRILRKIESKLKKQVEFNENICKYGKRIQCLLNAEGQLEKSLQRLAPYRNFLEKSVEKIVGFKCSMELINYYVLMNSETQLLEMLHHRLSNIEKKRIFIAKFLKNKMLLGQEQNNIIFYSNMKYTNNKNLKEELNTETHNQRFFIQNTMAGVLTMKHSCNNIFLRLIKWKTGTIPRKMDDKKKCALVIETLSELQDAVELAYQLYNKKDTSSQADSSFLTSRRMI